MLPEELGFILLITLLGMGLLLSIAALLALEDRKMRTHIKHQRHDESESWYPGWKM